MSLERFIDEVDGAERSLVVLNRTSPEPFQRMVEGLFEGQPVTVAEGVDAAADEDTVALIEEGDVVATSPLEALSDAILMVNSDLYSTGTVGLAETDVPDVIDGLADVPFTLRGYPESNSEKLILILISRHIERLAFEDGDGTLRSSFQRLSRIEDEKGTRRVYETVAETDVDVHVYGRPDWTPPREFRVTMHGGYKEEFRTSWFVVHTPPAGDGQPAALVAIAQDGNTWDGFWTYRPSLVADVADYIERNL